MADDYERKWAANAETHARRALAVAANHALHCDVDSDSAADAADAGAGVRHPLRADDAVLVHNPTAWTTDAEVEVSAQPGLDLMVRRCRLLSC